MRRMETPEHTDILRAYRFGARAQERPPISECVICGREIYDLGYCDFPDIGSVCSDCVHRYKVEVEYVD